MKLVRVGVSKYSTFPPPDDLVQGINASIEKGVWEYTFKEPCFFDLYATAGGSNEIHYLDLITVDEPW